MIRANCYPYTFKDKTIMSAVRDLIEGKVLNLFAGENIVCENEIRVDLDKTLPRIHFLMNVEDFLEMAKKDSKHKYNTIICDPPWNERKAKEFYEGRYIGKFTKLKDNIVKILNESGIIIYAGYEIDNLGRKRGMKLEHVIVVNPSGEIRPFFITVERKLPTYEF